METHRVIDMIPSREACDVTKWLKTYPNLQIVSRDGSQVYRKAIADAHPSALQVSDRFHILKNLTSYCCDYLRKKMNPKVPLSLPDSRIIESNDPILLTPAQENRKLTLQEKYEKIPQLLNSGYTKTQVCKKLNMDLRAYEKLMSATPEELQKRFQQKPIVSQEEKVTRKKEMAQQIRKLCMEGWNKSEISRETGLDPKTVRKYLKEDFNPVHASSGEKRASILDPYKKEIQNLFNQGQTSVSIEKRIRTSGYTGSPSSVSHYITHFKKQCKNKIEKEDGFTQETFDRKDIFKLIFRSLEKVRSITQEQFDLLKKEYPDFAQIYDLVWQFRAIFTGDDTSKLSLWVDEATKTQISELLSFIQGLKQDWQGVMNAIRYPFNNGLAEGSVNKIKVIKRIMYGRCCFDTLRTKVLKLESLRHAN